MAEKELIRKLSEKIWKENLLEFYNMGLCTSFRTGGYARLLIVPQDTGQLQYALAILEQENFPHVIMGNGSNLLVRDGGYAGAVIKLGDFFSSIEVKEDVLVAGAGALLPAVSKRAMEAGVSGLEFASGIPGSIGGAVFMNAGAYGGEIGHVLEYAQVLSRDGKNEFKLQSKDMAFGYRHSSLQESGSILIRAAFRLVYDQTQAIESRMKELTAKRNKKQPVSMPSAGSFFKRPEGYFAGKLIEDCGLKGISVGSARVSPLHAGFIVNEGGATATDIIDLMNLIRNTVYDRFGVMLEPEVRIIGDA